MPMPRQAHTYAVLAISPSAYEEIARLLKEAGYDHAFIREDGERPLINMHGIALAQDEPQPDAI